MSHGRPWTVMEPSFSCQLQVNAARVCYLLDAEMGEFSQVPSLSMGDHGTLRYLNFTFMN